jgi:hypothetical protein
LAIPEYGGILYGKHIERKLQIAATLFLAETGLWILHDERSLTRYEVENVARAYGVILHSKVTCPVFLTRRIMVASFFVKIYRPASEL